MSIREHCKGRQFKDIADTDAFRKADDGWRFESWNPVQWEKIVDRVIKEIDSRRQLGYNTETRYGRYAPNFRKRIRSA